MWFVLIFMHSKYAQSIRMMILHQYIMCDMFSQSDSRKSWDELKLGLKQIEIFIDFHWLSALLFYWFSIDFHWFSLIFSKCSKNLDFFRSNFNSSQLFRESLWENMSHMVYRCKMIMRIHCAWLDVMEINANHLTRQVYRLYPKMILGYRIWTSVELLFK